MTREPLVDIVVLVHDQAKWADLCVRSVEAFTKNPFALTIVDNASVEPETQAWLKEIENRGHRVVRLAENRSFSNGVNAGVNAGSAKYVIVLNDDCVVTEGWDTALLQDVSDKNVGLSGARSNFAAGSQGDPSITGEPKFLVFVCVAMRRATFNTVGPLDEENFDGFSGEDLDYSWRVKKAGLKLKVSNAFVFHAGSKTLTAKVGDADARARNDAKYVARLERKWGKEHLIEQTRVKPKILVTSYHAEEWTRVTFMGAFMNLKGGGLPFEFYQHTRSPISVARQAVADFALDKGYDWLVQVDDDATFPPDVIKRLLAHDKEVVTALAYQRKVPHATCVFETNEQGLGTSMEGIEHTGLRQVDCSGFHCSAIKTSVFRKLREAGIKQFYGGFEGKLGEDFIFSKHLKQVGIPLFCDTELISGHIGSAVVIDENYKKQWLAQGRPGLS